MLTSAAALLSPQVVEAHGGGLNSAGCHRQSSSNSSHCHRGSQAATGSPERLVSGRVTIRSCYDGDTCRTTAGEKIRLACIDTPELTGTKANPAPAKAARKYLNGLVAGKSIELKRITLDRYGRTVAELCKGGTNIQQQMVASGHAQIYWKYAHQCDWTCVLDQSRISAPQLQAHCLIEARV